MTYVNPRLFAEWTEVDQNGEGQARMDRDVPEWTESDH
jgi:hypothetical protein